ncbi:MAG: SDR family NAD(P)-dependent oxidoreductase [Actinomycetota bacterium]|nr:SDR family NAD(P)-dependent oxidoreductase [Actinomycetota bacterium]
MNDQHPTLHRVLLLGGTSEIGLATVGALALGPGAEVILAGRDPARLAAAGAGLPEHVDSTVRVFDARDVEGTRAVVAETFATGDVDLVIAAFGVLGDQAAFEADPASAAELVGVNVAAQAVALLEAARGLRAQGHGTIAVLSSIAGVRGRRANFVYGSSKAALDALGSGLDAALHGTGANVILVRPGFVIGRMTAGLAPAPLATTPEKVGRAVAAAVRTGRRQVWVPRRLRLVAWAARLVPRTLWVRLRR